jgi:hypothetical protein
MIQEIRCANSEVCLYRAGFGILCAINQPVNACMDQSACAHSARLDGRVHRNARKTVIADGSGRRSNRNDLCMRRRISPANHRVATARDHDTIAGQDGSDWDFAVFARSLCFGKCFTHHLFVIDRHGEFLADERNANVTERS